MGWHTNGLRDRPWTPATHSHSSAQWPTPICLTRSAFLQDEHEFWLLCPLSSRADVLGNSRVLPPLAAGLCDWKELGFTWLHALIPARENSEMCVLQNPSRTVLRVPGGNQCDNEAPTACWLPFPVSSSPPSKAPASKSLSQGLLLVV